MRLFVEQIARRAGAFLAARFGKDTNLRKLRGTPKDVVTKYDRLTDTLIVRAIRKKYPHSRFLTEESGWYGDTRSPYLWVIDSLDGTGNFATTNPLFCVSIALFLKGTLQLGVIYAPVMHELYVAEKGRGAFLNGKRIHVSHERSLKRAYGVVCEGANRDRKHTGRLFARLYPKVLDVRKLGSAELECAWVASGRADFYFTTQIEPYDVAAGVLLVEEAGGTVTDFEGHPWKLQRVDFFCSNSFLHERVRKLLHTR